MLNCPPISPLASKSTTSWPRSAAVVDDAMPAGPAPMTATLRFCDGSVVGSILSSNSYPAIGFTRHDARLPLKVWSRQAWLHPMHVLMSSSRPVSALATKCGSARNGRAMLIMSAQPSSSTRSATAGSLMRFVVQSGMPTSPLSFLVTHAKPPRGTEVAMVGMRASCQPMPVLMMDAPALSMFLASCTISGHEEPPSTRSNMLRR
mmetsp:Transcript_13769/g.40763  ORF Transcript_13769/g.40763 Transcript_13769/m.40763 type:complete len:205 (-) Transcript_13769:834-1448(-)